MTRRALVLFILFLSCTGAYSQDFFRENHDGDRKYIVLANPTISTINIVDFLVKKKVLDVDLNKINFVGVYYPGQVYDFSQSVRYISENRLTGFHMHEIKGKISEKDVFTENECTPELRTIFEKSAGIIFFGGPDIPPSVYGEENNFSLVTDPERHLFEVTFMFHLLGGKRNQDFKPFLAEKPEFLVTGFCLGMQTMNVATGGTLYQDIPAQIYNSTDPHKTIQTGKADLHRNYWQNISNDTLLMGVNIHPVKFTDHPFFGETVKTSKKLEPLVYTSHHQSVKEIGSSLVVTALSSDGKVIEGLTHTTFPHVFSVQFHPENTALYEDRESWKFSPDDRPKTFHDMLNRKSMKFHKTYWAYISSIINK